MYNWIINLWNSQESIYDSLPDNFNEDALFEGNISDITDEDSLKDIVVDKSQQLYYLALIVGSVYLYKILK